MEKGTGGLWAPKSLQRAGKGREGSQERGEVEGKKRCIHEG